MISVEKCIGLMVDTTLGNLNKAYSMGELFKVSGNKKHNLLLFCFRFLVGTCIPIPNIESLGSEPLSVFRMENIINFGDNVLLIVLPCSEGILIFPPNFAEYSGEKYEGHWKEGKMAGYGKMRCIISGYIYALLHTPFI